MGWTLADARTYLQDLNFDDTSTPGTRQYDKIINDANRALHGAGDWEFDRVRLRYAFSAQYTTGTVAITSDGSTVTGTNTVFTSAMDERYIRYGGENFTYRITAYASGTSLTVETYRGASDLTASTYAITENRKALDTKFRKFWIPTRNLSPVDLKTISIDEMNALHYDGKEVGDPRFCAVEWFTTSTAGGAPAPFLWVYPAPANKRVVEFFAYLWPVELSTSTDGISAPAEAEGAHREFMQAYLKLYQGKTKEARELRQSAHAMALHDLAQYRANTDIGRREEWSPYGDVASHSRDYGRMGPSEPVYD